MTRVTTDTSEVRAFAADMQALPSALNRQVLKIVERGAFNIKGAMQRDMRESRTFAMVAPTITYDVETPQGDGFIEASIGPDKSRSVRTKSGTGHPAALAQFAYYGEVNSGAKVRLPEEALNEEAPRFISELEKLMGEVFR